MNDEDDMAVPRVPAGADALRAVDRLIDRFADLPRPRKRLVVMLGDAILCVLAVWFAYFLRLGEWRFFSDNVFKLIAGSLAFWFPAAFITGVYKELFRYAGGWAIVTLARATALMLVPMITVFLFIFVPGVPRTLSVLQPIILFLFVSIARMALRYVLLSFRMRDTQSHQRRQILIYGAGAAGKRLATSIQEEPGLYLVGYVDDDPGKAGHRIDRKPIIAGDQLKHAIERHRITDLYLAMPRSARQRRAEIIAAIAEQPVQVMTLPAMRRIIEGEVTVSDLRQVEITDLLGRVPVAPDPELLARTITGKTVMVTGAGGSIGSELCRQVGHLKPAKLVLLEANEFALYSIDLELAQLRRMAGGDFPIVPELCNLVDRTSVMRIIGKHRPDTIFHAAAYKHVPLVEANILGGARNNIMGTVNAVDAAVAAGTRNFVLISTDKAVRPTNIMGATKRICEQLLQARAAEFEAAGQTIFAMVRFGNVLGSSGSVVPLFEQQIRAGGPITLTDKRITRYFMTVPEAAELVIQAGAMAKGGEVYVLDMGFSLKIIDLARTMIRLSGLALRDENNPDGDIAIEEVGLRPGEKLYEELLIGNNPQRTPHERILQAREHHHDLASLIEALRSLQVMLDDGDTGGVRSLIARLVPEYEPGDHLDVREG